MDIQTYSIIKIAKISISDRKLFIIEFQDAFYFYNQRIIRLKLDELILESQKLDN